MTLFQILAILLTLAAVFSYFNHRFIRLPSSIALMLLSILVSLSLLGLHHFAGILLDEHAKAMLQKIDFDETLLQGMLSFLLFAGALHINLDDLHQQRGIIAILATVGVISSTLLIGFFSFFLLKFLGIGLPIVYCLLLGALISPTDPIAVMGLLKQAKAPKTLETKIAGESLFNDGVGVVLFLGLLGYLLHPAQFDTAFVLHLVLQEIVGGIALGLLLGSLAFWMLRSVDNYQVEILLTLALVTGGYSLAQALHTSGPLAIVAAGLLIGNHGRLLAMSNTTRQHLDHFWELIDEILNAILFVLIGLEIIILSVNLSYWIAGLLLIPLALLSRWISVGTPVLILRKRRPFSPHAIKLLTWGGLRGGISIALALSLPIGWERDLLLTITYAVVLFSILVQGLTMPMLLKKVLSTTPK